jgi:hypothetical protein
VQKYLSARWHYRKHDVCGVRDRQDRLLGLAQLEAGHGSMDRYAWAAMVGRPDRWQASLDAQRRRLELVRPATPRDWSACFGAGMPRASITLPTTWRARQRRFL